MPTGALMFLLSGRARAVRVYPDIHREARAVWLRPELFDSRAASRDGKFTRAFSG
jgi:hypothetical protein